MVMLAASPINLTVLAVWGQLNRKAQQLHIYIMSQTEMSPFLQRVSIACYAKRCISHRKSVCLTVRPSHAGVKPKRLKLRPRGLHCRIAP